MDEPTRTDALLQQILETQQAHLQEYRKVSEELREMQRVNSRTYQEQARVYRRGVVVSGVALAAAVAWLFYCAFGAK
jgi:ferric-dicitrate binding protein FerR (iron transport regulator)